MKLRSAIVVMVALFGTLILTSLSSYSPSIAQDNPTPTPKEPDTAVNSVFQPEQRDFTDAMVQQLTVPDGFEVTVFAKDLGNPRMMVFGTDGTLYVTRPMTGDVVALKDAQNDGKADGMQVVASNLPAVQGITIRDNKMYLVANTKVFTADVNADGSLGTPQEVLSDLPESAQHGARTIKFGSDGMIYITIGSPCNACRISTDEYATILQVKPDFTARVVFASGLRNTIGFDWHPQTGQLWGADHGTDAMGDDVPPEEVNLIQQGKNYGWPHCYGDQQPNYLIPGMPEPGMTKEEYCATTTAPTVSYQAHSAPINLMFYTGTQFPEEYRDDAFITMRGSWNRSEATGYKVVHLNFEDDQPGELTDFLTGFLIEDGKAHFGRVAGLAMASDGSLFVSEDTNGVIYRITYTGN